MSLYIWHETVIFKQETPPSLQVPMEYYRNGLKQSSTHSSTKQNCNTFSIHSANKLEIRNKNKAKSQITWKFIKPFPQ